MSEAEAAFKFHMHSSNDGFVQGDLVFVKVKCVFYFWTCIPVQGVVESCDGEPALLVTQTGYMYLIVLVVILRNQ